MAPRDEPTWDVHDTAANLVERLLADALRLSPGVAGSAERVESQTSTRLVDWIDHLAAPVGGDELAAAGYVEGHGTRAGVWRHPGAQLPALVPRSDYEVALRVDDCAAFAAAHASGHPVEGTPGSGFRRVVAVTADPPGRVTLSGVERRSWWAGIEPENLTDDELAGSVRARALWAERPRSWGGADEVAEVADLARRMVELVGADLATAYVLELERAYWQWRNTAGARQHARQDRLGLGWGNNDHHTFRSSRAAFLPLMRVFGELGFEFRERFYAGAEAGWGAQVMEHPENGGVVFADLDLTPEEVAIDFAAATLPPRPDLGTVGLWCALHGESILVAGMHHLEGQFEFDRLRDDLSALGIGQMAPFSDFRHLRQAFTQAERWPVPADRLEHLVSTGRLDAATAARFASEGAPGSHLENLARRGGFKGFNQANVSVTMRATDPRLYRASSE